MTNKTLQQWLHELEQGIAGGVIHMGLDRIQNVRERMSLNIQCPIITVGGTNGKGSICTFLSEIYHQAGFKVGMLTSPHLLHFNERICINGKPVSDEAIVQSFNRIEEARQDTPLTYFEFNTLASVDIFCKENVDIMILEVGLGGRLDAVNIFDADVSIISSIDLDHQAYLGNTLEEIAREKAGIFRPHHPAIIGQKNIPQSLINYAKEISTPLLTIGTDFSFEKQSQQWSFFFDPKSSELSDSLPSHRRHALPIPALRGSYQIHNASCALAAIECLYSRLPVDISSIKRGLLLVKVVGRFQVLPGRPLEVWDVGHNPHAARSLRASLNTLPFSRHRYAIFSILEDKDIDSVIDIVKDCFNTWLVATLNLPRGQTAEALKNKLIAHGIHNIHTYNTVAEAYKQAHEWASEEDSITVFGSFHTVASAMICSGRYQ